MDKQSYFHGTGRRKTAVAQVKLMAGNGAIIIDGKPLEESFPSWSTSGLSTSRSSPPRASASITW